MNEVQTTVATSTTTMVPRGNAATMVAQTREMAEAIASVQMAKAFPRDIIGARDRILNACSRPRLAEVACYTYVRGGTEVTGPSIRLAESIAQNWGNMSFGIRELEQRNGESTCEAFAWDQETNTRQVKVFQVPHIRHTRKGDTLLTDPRDIYELIANNGARRLRACILGIIPSDIVDEAVNACEKTMKTNFEVTSELIRSLVTKFEEFGVSKEQIEERIQCRIDAMKPTQMANLGKIYNSLKDGMSKPQDWFRETGGGESEAGAATPKTARNSLAAALGLKEGKDAAKPAETPQTARKPASAANDGESEIEDLM